MDAVEAGVSSRREGRSRAKEDVEEEVMGSGGALCCEEGSKAEEDALEVEMGETGSAASPVVEADEVSGSRAGGCDIGGSAETWRSCCVSDCGARDWEAIASGENPRSSHCRSDSSGCSCCTVGAAR